MRLVVALLFMGVGLMRIAKWVWIINTDSFAHETTLLGGRWNVGKRGMRVYLVLSVVEGVGYVVTGLAVLVGWFNVMFPVLAGTACLSILLSVLGAWPLIVWGYIALLLPFAVALGAVWILFHFGWFK